MIYYIVAVDKAHNEHVVSSHDTAERATREVERWNKQENGFQYRIDTVPSAEEIRAANAAIPADPNKIKAKINKAYGKAGDWVNPLEQFIPAVLSVPDSHYKDSDSIRVTEESVAVDVPAWRTEDFTIDKLFPQGTHDPAYTLTCSECACEVKNYIMVLDNHTKWHNKLLP